MRCGFTLVELSIVLVIIGLLIGGILVAQSMIGTARIQSFVRQLQQFDVAVVNFNTKYNGLPGDSSRFYSGGNNDRILQNTPVNYESFSGEFANFWYDLQISGLTVNGANFVAEDEPTKIILDKHIPKSQINSESGVVVYGAKTSGGLLDPGDVNNNFYELGNFKNTTGAALDGVEGSIKAADALAIDAKIDNSIANSGAVFALDPGGLDNVDPPNATSCRLAAATYNASYSAKICNLRIKMLSQTGF